MSLRWFTIALLLGCPSADAGDDASTDTAAEETSATSSPATSASASSSASVTTEPPDTTSTTEPPPGSSGEMSSSSSSSSTGEPFACRGDFPAMWNDGTSCPEDDFHVHQYSENTFILRQSLCTNFEGPFLYMLFGNDRVLLEDTGAGGVAVRDAVMRVVDGWLEDNGKESIELVVVNSHAHGDHVAGNGQFVGQPNTTVVGYLLAEVESFFGITGWPDEIVQYDLGGREIDIIPIPGHHSTHIAIYDPEDGLLLTGDTLYPGRLYISDWTEYGKSIDRMVDHVDGRDVCHVLGTHIEMTDTPGVDYGFGEDQHADEHPLELTLDHLEELQAAVQALGDTPAVDVHDDFIIYPL